MTTETILNFATNRDPFADTANINNTGEDGGNLHIRVKQRNGRKSITSVEGLSEEECAFVLSDIKKKFCCNGSIQVDEKLGKFHNYN